MTRVTGTYRPTTKAGETVQAFVPYPLLPTDPPLDAGGRLDPLVDRSMNALARLEVAGSMVPSTDWFLYGFVRKEAVLTSQIEGTQATLRDVLAFEATEESDRPDDVEEVCNYVKALTFARRELSRPKGLPLGTRLLCEAHKRLMRGVRGSDRQPGRVRKSQNWIGGTRPGNATFVPPPPDEVAGALDALEQWIHSADPHSPLVRIGLAHAQFETIHPFLDGNGRIGRLLITLLLEHWQILKSPSLYLSLAFKHHQRAYYDRLTDVRTKGDWEGWIEFFLECVREAADDGVNVAQRIYKLLGRDRRRLTAHERTTVAAIRLLDVLPEHPIVTVPRVVSLLDITAPTARKAIEIAEAVGILRETTGRQRDRVYAYHTYLQILTGGES